jgi:hypothetical protein
VRLNTAPALLDRTFKIPGESRRIFAGQSGGVRCAILSSQDGAGRFTTIVTRARCAGELAGFSLGSTAHQGDGPTGVPQGSFSQGQDPAAMTPPAV